MSAFHWKSMYSFCCFCICFMWYFILLVLLLALVLSFRYKKALIFRKKTLSAQVIVILHPYLLVFHKSLLFGCFSNYEMSYYLWMLFLSNYDMSYCSGKFLRLCWLYIITILDTRFQRAKSQNQNPSGGVDKEKRT